MNGMYEIKGSNTLYKVWGIITFIFTGIYGLLNLIGFVIVGIGVSAAGKASRGLAFGIGDYVDDYIDSIKAYIFVIILLLVFTAIVGIVIRIFAGIYLVRPGVKSKGGLLAVGILYFFLGLLNLARAVFLGKEMDSVAVILVYLFFMVWAIITGVLLIMKQASAVTRITSVGQNPPPEPPPVPPLDPSVNKNDTRHTVGRYQMEANIEGMFGEYIGKKYILRTGESCKIGRDSGCDIQLHHSKVSRIHCSVKLLPDGRFEVTDYSYNGTFYENKALPSNAASIVQAGGLLVIGDADNVFALNIDS